MARRFSPELIFGLVGSLAVHALWFVGEANASGSLPVLPQETEVSFEIPLQEVDMEPEAQPEPEPEPEPDVNEAPPPAPSARADESGRSDAPKDLPSAAQAGQTLTAPETDSPPEPAMADFTLVQGEGGAYVGGTTAAKGESQTAVRGRARNGPSTTKAAAAPTAKAANTVAPKGPDRSRPARPANGAWSCSHLFPSDPGAPNFASVMILVTVREDGSPRSIQVMSDPGFGFGAAARTCALSQRYTPALDRNGNAITSVTPPITVRFSR